MNYRKVTAIIPTLALEGVENNLKHIGVSGMSVSNVHGYGEYRNFFTNDRMTDCSRIEIFTEADKAKDIVNAIAKATHQGLDSDGVIAVLPVEDFFHIHEFKEVNDDGK